MDKYDIFVDNRTGENYVVVSNKIPQQEALSIANKFFKTKLEKLFIGSANCTTSANKKIVVFCKEYNANTKAISRVCCTSDCFKPGETRNCWVIIRRGKLK